MPEEVLARQEASKLTDWDRVESELGGSSMETGSFFCCVASSIALKIIIGR
jgi:hypothetical protein